MQSCRDAVTQITALSGVRVEALSRWYDSAPIPAGDQPRYVNGVAALQAEGTPEWLLGALQRIEAVAGRVRGAANAARMLDLDIVDMNGMVRTAPDPVLPHPRTHLRGFVLHPLRDVAPGWVHPVLGQTVETLIAALPAQDIAPLKD